MSCRWLFAAAAHGDNADSSSLLHAVDALLWHCVRTSAIELHRPNIA